MKAEHRKELETNILADRMGRLVQRMKTRPQRRVFVYVIAAVVVLAGLLIFFNMRGSAALENSEHWRWLEEAGRPELEQLKSEKETNPGKAARFQFAWLALWDEGMMLLGVQPKQALEHLDVAEFYYRSLAEECADDPVWEPEALYHLAVIEETRAIRREDRSKHLETAKERYQKLARKYKDSAHGKTAAARAKLLEDNIGRVSDFYADLDSRLEIERQIADAERAEQLFKNMKK